MQLQRSRDRGRSRRRFVEPAIGGFVIQAAYRRCSIDLVEADAVLSSGRLGCEAVEAEVAALLGETMEIANLRVGPAFLQVAFLRDETIRALIEPMRGEPARLLQVPGAIHFPPAAVPQQLLGVATVSVGLFLDAGINHVGRRL